jgi:CHAT domain-containing protein
VSDEGTLTLMSEFYRQMSRPEVTIKAEGLRQAQLSMLNKEVILKDGSIRGVRGTPIKLPDALPINLDLSHPFYWAGFTIVGSPW